MRRRTVLQGMATLPVLAPRPRTDTVQVDITDDERPCYGAFQY